MSHTNPTPGPTGSVAGNEAAAQEAAPAVGTAGAAQGAAAPVNPAAAEGKLSTMGLMGRALAVGGGVGAGALGLGALIRHMRRRKKENNPMAGKTVEAQALDFLVDLATKTAQDVFKKEAAQLLVRHLDHLAAKLPLEKTASVRIIQKEVSQGKSLAYAIKQACPSLTGEERGILASQLVRSAIAHQKRANEQMGYGPSPTAAAVPTQTMQTANVPMAQAPGAMSKIAMEKKANALLKLLKSRGMLGLGAAGGAGAGIGALLGGSTKPPQAPTLPSLTSGPMPKNPLTPINHALGG